MLLNLAIAHFVLRLYIIITPEKLKHLTITMFYFKMEVVKWLIKLSLSFIVELF